MSWRTKHTPMAGESLTALVTFRDAGPGEIVLRQSVYDEYVAQDGWRVFDWDYGDFDARFARRPLSYGGAAGGPSVREALASLELPAKCAVAGAFIALLYGWPVLMVASIFGALSSRVFAAVLAAAALVGSVACWVVSSLERRRWAQRDRIPDWVDPPPWK